MKIFLATEVLILVGASIVFFCIGRAIGEKKGKRSIQQVFVQEENIPTVAGLGSKTSELEGDALEQDILLVNRDNRLPENYEVELLTLPDGVNRAAAEAYEPLCDMLEAGRKEGLAFEICSSYRDVERQQELFDEDVDMLMRQGYTYRDAYEEVARETITEIIEK